MIKTKSERVTHTVELAFSFAVTLMMAASISSPFLFPVFIAMFETYDGEKKLSLFVMRREKKKKKRTKSNEME